MDRPRPWSEQGTRSASASLSQLPDVRPRTVASLGARRSSLYGANRKKSILIPVEPPAAAVRSTAQSVSREAWLEEERNRWLVVLSGCRAKPQLTLPTAAGEGSSGAGGGGSGSAAVPDGDSETIALTRVTAAFGKGKTSYMYTVKRDQPAQRLCQEAGLRTTSTKGEGRRLRKRLGWRPCGLAPSGNPHQLGPFFRLVAGKPHAPGAEPPRRREARVCARFEQALTF